MAIDDNTVEWQVRFEHPAPTTFEPEWWSYHDETRARQAYATVRGDGAVGTAIRCRRVHRGTWVLITVA